MNYTQCRIVVVSMMVVLSVLSWRRYIDVLCPYYGQLPSMGSHVAAQAASHVFKQFDPQKPASHGCWHSGGCNPLLQAQPSRPDLQIFTPTQSVAPANTAEHVRPQELPIWSGLPHATSHAAPCHPGAHTQYPQSSSTMPFSHVAPDGVQAAPYSLSAVHCLTNRK